MNELELLKEIEYVRFGGTKQEYKTALWIKEKLAELGIDSKYEPFKVNASVISKQTLKVTKPYEEEIETKAYFCSPSVKELKAPLYYCPNTDEISLSKVRGKIVMVDGYLGYWRYKDLYDNKAVGIIVHNGDLYDDNKDIDQREIREQLQEVGLLPVVQINTKDAYKLVQNGAEEVCISIESKDVNAQSGNVICDLKGKSDKTIIFTAHYDSTWLSKGAYDNATGTIGLLKIAQYFKIYRPYHNLRFVFCGSEERGLLGSKAYVKAHEEELKDIALCINLDMIGSTMGQFGAFVTADNELVSYVKYLACEKGFPLTSMQEVYSSDSTPFADKGVPALSFARNTHITPIHCHHDTIESLSLKRMQEDIEFIIEFTKRMANAKVFPVKHEIPENMKEQLDKYMCRKRNDLK